MVDLDIVKAQKEKPVIRLSPCGSVTVRFVDQTGQAFQHHHLRGQLARPPLIQLKLIVDPAQELPSAETDTHTFDWVVSTNLDQDRYSELVTDGEGRVTFPTVIPEAPYALTVAGRDWRVKQTFTVRPGQELDLSNVTMQRPR